ncbi:MAG: YhjD/YihY/BrkB family envelope integrity protein [Actinomycetota bacterium]
MDHPLIDAAFQVVSRDRLLAGGLLASAVAFRVFLWIVPRPDGVPMRALVPGALLVGAVVELLHLVSLVYLPGKFDRASSAYGSLGIAVVALAWLYFSGRAVVAGAVLNVTLWDRRGGRNGNAGIRDHGVEPEPRRTGNHD